VPLTNPRHSPNLAAIKLLKFPVILYCAHDNLAWTLVFCLAQGRALSQRDAEANGTRGGGNWH
jgi:hypothetical protein